MEFQKSRFRVFATYFGNRVKNPSEFKFWNLETFFFNFLHDLHKLLFIYLKKGCQIVFHIDFNKICCKNFRRYNWDWDLMLVVEVRYFLNVLNRNWDCCLIYRGIYVILHHLNNDSILTIVPQRVFPLNSYTLILRMLYLSRSTGSFRVFPFLIGLILRRQSLVTDIIKF